VHQTGTSKNLLRVALLFCDARCTSVQLRFSNNIAAARYGFSMPPETVRRRQLRSTERRHCLLQLGRAAMEAPSG
jgi:hypothetical protein